MTYCVLSEGKRQVERINGHELPFCGRISKPNQAAFWTQLQVPKCGALENGNLRNAKNNHRDNPENRKPLHFGRARKNRYQA
jgi:hypothetical protein